MSAASRERRVSLAQSYRALGEKQIRARLEGPLSDVERVIAQAELIRRGADSDDIDTSPATGFAPTSALDLDGAEAPEAALELVEPAPGGGRRRLVGALVLAAIVVAIGVVIVRKLLAY